MRYLKTKKTIFVLAGIAVAGIIMFQSGVISQLFFRPTDTQYQTGVRKNDALLPGGSASDGAVGSVPPIEIVAEELAIPWEIVFLPASPVGGPGGEMLVTERPGRLLKLGERREVIEVNGVRHVGEGGLLGAAVHPDFERTQWVYLYLTTETVDGLRNRVERYRLAGNRLFDRLVLLEDIPGARFHDGGRIEFGPDGLLYITTGDAGNEDAAQERDTLNGKILRIRDDGSIPADNPYGNAIYSYGHRNPQGLAWDERGRLWASEHGRSGFRSGFDELNLIEKGKNYGWPVIQGPETRSGMVTAKIQSGADETWAPAGAAYLPDRSGRGGGEGGSIFFAGLRGESLYEARINDIGKVSELLVHFQGEFGRLRAVVVGPDGYLYITTSNTDGRGTVREGDDKIIKINPGIFRD